jgi:hypothetical protein
VIAYKFLRSGRVAPFSGVAWPAPTGDGPGAWLTAVSGGRACDGRVHACRVEDLPEWLDAELWRVELEGNVAVDCRKLVADRGRLHARVNAWDADVAAALAEHCALRARDGALSVLTPGRRRAALAYCASMPELEAAASTIDLTGHEGRAIGYVLDAARHAIAAFSRPADAPRHAAANGFIATHAAAFAARDVAAAPRERAAQAAWLVQRLGL